MNSKPFQTYSKWRILKNLSPEEKSVLSEYLIDDTKTKYFELNDGIIGGLELKSILFRSANLPRDQKYAFNIDDWVWNYLHKHPRLIAVRDSHAKSFKEIFQRWEKVGGRKQDKHSQ